MVYTKMDMSWTLEDDLPKFLPLELGEFEQSATSIPFILAYE